MENMGFGLEITVLGMGLVFLLLALLWGLLELVLRFDRAPATEVSGKEATAEAEQIALAAEEAVGAQIPLPLSFPEGIDADTLAAIMIAVLTHKTVLRRQAAPVMRSYWPGSLLYASRWVATGRSRQNRSWQRRG